MKLLPQGPAAEPFSAMLGNGVQRKLKEQRNKDLVVWAMCVLCVAALVPANPSAAQTGAPAANKMSPAKLSFNQSIQPMLAENCYPCHGPDLGARKAKLRLDRPLDRGVRKDRSWSDSPTRIVRNEARSEFLPKREDERKTVRIVLRLTRTEVVNQTRRAPEIFWHCDNKRPCVAITRAAGLGVMCL
jgi:hypothetical protein